jgi:Flp pilus assembly pilin Flp
MRTRPTLHLPAVRFARGLHRDERGATITEYALILFLVLVVAAGGWKVFGAKLNASMGKTTATLEASGDTPHQGGGGGGAGGGGGGAAAGGAAGGAGGGTDDSFGGSRTRAKEAESSSLPKLAMIALAIIGGAAIFFTAMKGKSAR